MEALPYLKAFREKIFVIKYGGSALGDPALRQGILRDVVFLSLAGVRPILVHGGGPDISRRMASRGRQAHFVDGLRVTDAGTLCIVAQELKRLNRLLVAQIRALGGQALGLASHARTILKARRATVRGQDVGFVGEIVGVRPQPILAAVRRGAIPVVWPLGLGPNRQLYNVNADRAAAELAGALKAEKLVLVTDVRGILRHDSDGVHLIPTVKANEVERLVTQGVIAQGMIPKARACVQALNTGVHKTHMVDVKIPHVLLLEIFTDRGIGTEIVKGSSKS